MLTLRHELPFLHLLRNNLHVRISSMQLRLCAKQLEMQDYFHIHAIPVKKLALDAFADAAWALRPDGSSRGEYLIYADHQDLIEGRAASMSIIDRKSWRLKRKV